jgi:glycosyltransferase involved in cell wall biosynthesis
MIAVNCRLDRTKGVNTILRAFADLKSVPTASLMIVGDGPEHLALTNLAAELQISDRVVFCGWQNNPLPIVAGATVFVQASDFEGFSNSILEALFLDTPIITSYCSSDARLMCDLGAALGFEVGDSRELARCLERVLTSDSLRANLVCNAAEYRRPFELTVAIKCYEDLVIRAIGGVSVLPKTIGKRQFLQ